MLVAREMVTNRFVADNRYFCQSFDKTICMLSVMETYAERLTWAMERAEMSQSDLARVVGIKPQSIQYLCDSNRNAQGSKYNSRMAAALSVSATWLETGKGDRLARDGMITAGASVEPGPDIRGRVPLISWIQAGGWERIVDNFTPGDAEDWMPCPTKYGEHTFALRVRGVSMEPKYQDGDIIFVDPDAQAEHGKNVVVRLDEENEATFKQLVIEGERKFLKPLNPDWPGPKLIQINGNATICGVVIGKWVPE